MGFKDSCLLSDYSLVFLSAESWSKAGWLKVCVQASEVRVWGQLRPLLVHRTLQSSF